jgi:tetratricopeptide (TPR) repeat protein
MAFKIQNGQNFLGLLNLRLNSTGVVNIVHPFSFFQRVGIASYGFIVYILKFIIPVNIFLYYPYPEISEFTHGSFYFSLILSFLGVLLILGFTLYSLKRSKLFLMGLGFYFLSIVLVLQFISVGLAIIATRYTYLPYIGLVFIPAVYISKTKGKKMFVLLGVFSLFILMNMFLSIKEVRKWNNTETLWSSLIEKYPHIEIPRRSRAGYYYIKASRTNDEREKRILEDKALLDFNELIATKTKSPDVFEGIAMIYERRNNFTSALQYINQAIVLDTARARTYYNRALIYDDLNQKENAINDYGTALRLSSDMTIQVLSNKSVLLIETKRFAEAIKDLDLLIKIKPDDPRFYCNRAFSKIQLNDIAGAKNDYLVAFNLDPKNQTIIKQLQILESIESK